MTGAVGQVFAVALYHYAADGEVRGGFAGADLEHPFTGRRGGPLGRLLGR